MELLKPTLQEYLQTAVNIKRLRRLGLYSKLEENIKVKWKVTDAKPVIWHISASHGCNLPQIIANAMDWAETKEGQRFWYMQYCILKEFYK